MTATVCGEWATSRVEIGKLAPGRHHEATAGAYGFSEAHSRNPDALLGDCWTAAVRHYYDKEQLATIAPTKDWYPASIFFQGMKSMVYGDPTLPMGKLSTVINTTAAAKDATAVQTLQSIAPAAKPADR